MTALTTRIKIAWQVLRGKQVLPPRRVYEYKEIPIPMFDDEYEPSWSLGGFDQNIEQVYISEGFNTNAVIYACLMYKYRASMIAPLRGWRGDVDNPEPLDRKDPLSKLLARPNNFQSGREFTGLNTIYKNLLGESFIFLDRPKKGAFPTAMIPMRRDRVRIITKEDSEEIRGFYYRPSVKKQGFPILVEDMMHIKFPNPGDDLGGRGHGYAPMGALAMAGDVDNQITKFLKVFFERGGMPPVYIKYDIPLDDDQVARARDRFMQMYGGSHNWGQVAVIDQSGEVKQVSMNFDEMGFEAIDERNESRMHMPFGVPPILTGSRVGLKHATYSNYQEARQAFWEDTMIPETLCDQDEFQHFLNTDDSFVMYDLSEVPALRQDTIGMVNAAYQMWQMGVPANNALREVGLDVEAVDGGDQGFVPGSVVPVEEAAKPPEPVPVQLQPQQEPEEEEAGKALKKKYLWERKAKTGDKVVEAAQNWEGKFGDSAREAFEHDKKEILVIIGEAKKKALARKENIVWLDIEKDVLDYLKNDGAENWRETFVPQVSGLMVDVGDLWALDLGIAFNVRNLRGEAWFDEYMLEFAQPINDTSSGAIHDILARGQAEGWSVPKMQDALENLFRQYMDGDLSEDEYRWFADRMPPHRTELIARTETTRAQGAGVYNLGKEWGADEKEWMATADDRTRPSHSAADGQRVKIDDPFKVGGYDMMYPGDTSKGAPVSEIADCRCTHLLYMPEED